MKNFIKSVYNDFNIYRTIFYTVQCLVLICIELRCNLTHIALYCLSKCVSIPSILFSLSIRFLFSLSSF